MRDVIFSIIIICGQLFYSCSDAPVKEEKTQKHEVVFNEVLERANNHYQNDDFYNASLALDTLIDIDSNNGEVYYKKAVCLAYFRKEDSSVIYFNRSAELGYKKADSYYNIAMKHYHFGNDSLCLFYLNKVLSISSNDSAALDVKKNLLNRINEQKNANHRKADFSSL